MNQMDERWLSLVVIDPFAPGMIQSSFGDFCPPAFVQYILRGLWKDLCTVWHTWCGAEMLSVWINLFQYAARFHSSGPHWPDVGWGEKMHYCFWLKITYFSRQFTQACSAWSGYACVCISMSVRLCCIIYSSLI